MADGTGLSVGATNLTAVVVDRAAVRRSAVLTLFDHRPPEVGVPSENPGLNERGLVITGFTDRVGDPVAILAADGSTHRADVLTADALRAMLYALGRGRRLEGPVAIAYPAHWRAASVDALRGALGPVADFQRPAPAYVVSDATAAMTALRDDPGVPSRGVIALCDFGGSGTSVTLIDAADAFRPIGPTVRHPDLSGDLIDQALLTRVIDDMTAAGTIDLSSTSAIGSLTRLRAQCRGAKERLSTSAVTSLHVELPGHRSEVRVTRNELDEAIRAPLAEFVGALQDTVQRSGIRAADLVAVATAGGGARIPMITTTLSESLRVPVVTTVQPELTAAIGAGLVAQRGAVEEGVTSMAAAPAVAAAAGEQSTEAQSSTFRALAWSDADVPEVAPADPYDGYDGPGAVAGAVAGADVASARPPVQFGPQSAEPDGHSPPLPMYRRPAVLAGVGLVAVVGALVAAAVTLLGEDSASTPASTTTVSPTPPTTVTAPVPAPSPPPTEAPGTRTVTRQAPPATVTRTQPPPTAEVPAPTSEAPPPPTSEAPPPTSEAPPPTQQPLPPGVPSEIPILPGVTIPIGPPAPRPAP